MEDSNKEIGRYINQNNTKSFSRLKSIPKSDTKNVFNFKNIKIGEIDGNQLISLIIEEDQIAMLHIKKNLNEELAKFIKQELENPLVNKQFIIILYQNISKAMLHPFTSKGLIQDYEKAKNLKYKGIQELIEYLTKIKEEVKKITMNEANKDKKQILFHMVIDQFTKENKDDKKQQSNPNP
ncbi:hypothetical protein ABPG74_001875 [Tetrahymena malaccensis]